MKRKIITLASVACLAAGLLWADASSSNIFKSTSETSTITANGKTKHHRTTKISIRTLTPQPIPQGLKSPKSGNP